MEDNRTGSADSENGSSDSYVQVSKEDAHVSDPILETARDANPEEDIYTSNDEQPEEGDFTEMQEDAVLPSSETFDDKEVTSSPIEEVAKKPEGELVGSDIAVVGGLIVELES